MTDIYDQHKAAFSNVSAFVVTKGDDMIATVAFKRLKSTICYLHIQGAQMVRARAGGTSYDKRSAAIYAALARITVEPGDTRTSQRVGAFRDAVTDNGASWDQDLRRAGFSVWQAV